MKFCKWVCLKDDVWRECTKRVCEVEPTQRERLCEFVYNLFFWFSHSHLRLDLLKSKLVIFV